MKKSVYIAFIMTLSLIFVTVSEAQQLRLGLGGGLTAVQSPDAYTNNISDGGLGFKTNYHLTAELRLDFPLIPFTPLAFVNYHSLSGSGSGAYQSVETSQKILSIGAEVEVSLLPLPFVKPYFSVSVASNSIGEQKISSPAGTLSQSSRTRMGGGIGIGTLVTILPFDMDLSAKYSFLNFVGKESGEENLNIINVDLVIIF